MRRIGLTDYDICEFEPNAWENFEVRGPDLDFPTDLPLHLIEQKLFERVGIVQEWKGENTDRKEQDRQNTEHQCSETNGVTPFLRAKAYATIESVYPNHLIEIQEAGP